MNTQQTQHYIPQRPRHTPQLHNSCSAGLMVCMLTALIALLASGCAPMATYPPVEHTRALSRPAYEPIPTLMAESFRYAHERYQVADELIFNLPEGVTTNVYHMVARKLGEARPMFADDERAYTISEIRTRGSEAQADLIYPRADGLHQLVTIYFKASLLDGWKVASTRQWRIYSQAPQPRFTGEWPTDTPAEAVATQPTDTP